MVSPSHLWPRKKELSQHLRYMTRCRITEFVRWTSTFEASLAHATLRTASQDRPLQSASRSFLPRAHTGSVAQPSWLVACHDSRGSRFRASSWDKPNIRRAVVQATILVDDRAVPASDYLPSKRLSETRVHVENSLLSEPHRRPEGVILLQLTHIGIRNTAMSRAEE